MGLLTHCFVLGGFLDMMIVLGGGGWSLPVVSLRKMGLDKIDSCIMSLEFYQILPTQ